MIFRIILFILCINLPFVCTWMYNNWKTHTDKWLEEKWINWLKRPLSTNPSRENRRKIMKAYPSEEWESYPYLMIDAILDFSKDAEEVTKWAIYYTFPPDHAFKYDMEYRRIIGLPTDVSSHV